MMVAWLFRGQLQMVLQFVVVIFGGAVVRRHSANCLLAARLAEIIYRLFSMIYVCDSVHHVKFHYNFIAETYSKKK